MDELHLQEIALLSRALELDPNEREPFLAQECRGDQELFRRVKELIFAHERAGDFLESAPTEFSNLGGATFKPASKETAVQQIGRYRLREQIGEGGCGVVYRAEQEEPVRREVALKIIKLGMDTEAVMARFEAERQVLALMDHPHIAKVFDAGASETGRPYFVMELVRGEKITSYCESRDLPIAERLRLFVLVCHAIQHAHQKGVIHRDIKPSNILVHDSGHGPVPKVIDFGIAKATQGRLTDRTMFTAMEQFVGTPAYMSPEQAALTSHDVDTRSDIYSLGVLLYELLTGVTPFDQKALLAGGLDEMRRTIRDVEPRKPSLRLSSLVRVTNNAPLRRSAVEPDLDWIVMKCLEKDRTRRYATANGLATDIERHLQHEPIVARPPTAGYRVGKWIRRNRLAFAGLTLVLAALITVALVSTIAVWRVAEARRAEHHERQKAESANRQLRGTVDLLELERAEGFLQNRDAAMGVAYLAAMLGRDASNSVAANRIVSALVHNDWMLPHATPLRHLGPVESVEFSPDGTHVLSASRDGKARIWNVATGRTVVSVSHRDWVVLARFSPDGTRFLTGSRDGTARIWSATNGASLTASLPHTGPVTCAEFSVDGRWVITGSEDRSVRMWNTDTGKLRQTFSGHSQTIVAARFNPDATQVFTVNKTGGQRSWSVETGQTLKLMNIRSAIHDMEASRDGSRLVTAYDDGKARIWDTEKGLMLGSPLVHSAEGYPVWQARFSPSGQHVLTCGEDGTAQLWETETGRPLGPRLRHASGVISGAFSRDGRVVVTTSSDNTARLWDATTGAPLGQPMRSRERILQAAFSPDVSRLATASYAWTVQLWDITPRRDNGLTLAADDGVQSLAFSPDGQTLLAGGRDGSVTLWTPGESRTAKLPTALSGPVTSVEFTPDGSRFVAVASNRSCFIYDSRTRETATKPLQHDGVIRTATFSPDGHHIATSSDDHSARVWNVSNGEPVSPALLHRGNVLMSRFAPNGRWLATASEDRTARVWDVSSGTPVTEPLAHLDHVKWVDFSPDGRRLVTASTDNTAAVWDLPSGQRIGAVLQHTRIVERAFFSPDGHRIATASLDRTVRLWNAETGQALTPPMQHEFPVAVLCFSPDGKRLASGCRNYVRLWDVETGRPLTERLPMEGWVWAIAFDPSGRRLAAGARSARLWELPSAPTPVPEWFTSWTESIAGLRLDIRGNPELLLWSDLTPASESTGTNSTDRFYRQLANWFLSVPAHRPLTPF